MNVRESGNVPVATRLLAKLRKALRQDNGTLPSIRERHEALVNANSPRTPEERREILDRAAKRVDTEALARGDAVFARYLEMLEAGEVQDNSGSGRHPRG